jgi:uncharacterized protein (TIGR00290 family)
LTVRRELLEAQARAAELPLFQIQIPYPCSNEQYETVMGDAVRAAQERGVTHMAFGDLFLEDIRAYRDQKLASTGLEPIYPLWGTDTRELAQEMITAGLVAYVTCVDPRKLDPSFAGARFDTEFLSRLPAGVDPCGENGEFHTFVTAGPMFKWPIATAVGEVVERDGFVFADLVAKGGSP